MPRIIYTPKKFSGAAWDRISQANEIIAEYAAQGYDLTLRQLYYQFVARGYVPNDDREYKRLRDLISDARLAGAIDWASIVDRTRFIRENSHWSSPSSIIAAAAASYRIDRWQDQSYHVEVWVEKDALVGVIENVCRDLDVIFFSCRGYTSQSELWAAAQRMRSYEDAGKRTVVLHLGDHDPSGIDMTRDIQDRLRLFRSAAQVVRIALNMDQVDAYGPPPNPAKITDSRCTAYMAAYGEESWELDALEPSVLSDLIRIAVEHLRDKNKWDEAVREEEGGRNLLAKASGRWREVERFLNDKEAHDEND